MPSPVVDAHVHLLPPRLQAAIRDFFFARGFPGDGFAYPADPAEVCDRLAAEGITEAWSLPYARRPGSAGDLNQAMARFAAAHADGAVKVIGGCTVHPADDRPADLVRAAVQDLGLRVLKLHCSVGDFAPDDRRLDPVWEYVSAVALPVVLHAGHAPDGQTEAAELAPVATVARRHPEARIIIAHCGHAASDVALRLVAEHPWVHADLTPVLHQPVRPAPAALAAVAGKVLFGSDAPNTGLTVSGLLAGLGGADGGISAEARAAITGGTAQRLIAGVRA
ncbi:MAG TPA: amidohydrolase family protein [Streptosporangiaceae bacterium]